MQQLKNEQTKKQNKEKEEEEKQKQEKNKQPNKENNTINTEEEEEKEQEKEHDLSTEYQCSYLTIPICASFKTYMYETTWPSGLRRVTRNHFSSGGVGSNPAVVAFCMNNQPT